MEVLLLFITTIPVVVLLMFWGVHISQVYEFTKQSGWAGYSKFKREFKKVDWGHKENFSNSLFEKESYNSTEYHAGIIQFNRNGMMIHNPLSYLLVKVYVFRYIRKHFKIKKPKRQKIKW